MFEYSTTFTLTGDVNDLEEAREYLTEDDMTVYLKESVEFADAIEKIEWVLVSTNHGRIELASNRELTDAELKEVSDWVSGQNSDGLGEGFEQQSFAWNEYVEEDDYFEDEDYGYADYGDGEMVSFDWQTNGYAFSLKR